MDLTAVILAGGKSSRMGRDKLCLDFGGLSLLESAVRRFGAYFDKVVVSVGDLSKYPDIKAEKVEDIYKESGPMSGLHAAMKKYGRRCVPDGGGYALCIPRSCRKDY